MNPSGAASPPSPAGPILVADDDPITRLLFSRALRNAGFEAVEAATGGQVLDAVDGQHLSAVLLDNRMPGLSGPDLIRELRTRKTSDVLPIIVVSGMDATEDRLAGLHAGANDYLTKPVELGTLVAHVRAQLGRQADPAAGGSADEARPGARPGDVACELVRNGSSGRGNPEVI